MSCSKIAITIDRELLGELDGLVAASVYPSRSAAIQDAVRERLARVARTRLAAECARLDPAFEQRLADEGLAAEAGEWPEY